MTASRDAARFDAVIVGAGPAGSGAAILLARAGWKVALVERLAFPRGKVCGECVAASNLPLLDAWGIGDAFGALAGPELREVVLHHGRRRVAARLPAAHHPRHAWGRSLGRATLDSLLLDQARAVGAEVHQPWSLQTIEGGPGDWQCGLRGAATTAQRWLAAPVFIDAHGSWEGLRSGDQPLRRAPQPTDLLGFKATFEGSHIRAGAIHVLALDGAYGGMVLGDHGTATLACCIRRDRLDAIRHGAPGSSAGDAVQAWLSHQCAGVHHALQDAARQGPWLASGPIQPGARALSRDGSFRIGNAAGEAHPILGEGMSMALQSAAMLCAALLGDGRAGRPPDASTQRALQRRLAQDWQRRFGPRLRLASVFAHASLHPWASALLMATLRAWPGLLTAGARWGGKVDVFPVPATSTGKVGP